MASWIAQLVVYLAVVPISYATPLSPLAPCARILDDASHLKPEYDFVIIGGGTSGLTVANRLTENPDSNDRQDGGTSVPGLPVPDKYKRNYESVPQAGLNGRTSPIYTGAVVGGGSVVNGMFFNRGSAGDYDAWEKLGNPGWGWKNLLPYFKKSETFTPPTREIDESFPGVISSDMAVHGTDGPVGSSFSTYQYPVIKNFFRGWNSIGVATQPEPNGGNANGAFYSTVSMKFWNQSRSSTTEAYYRYGPDRRDNFHLLTGHQVARINLNAGKRATSVDFKSRNSDESSDESTWTARTCREIVLAAGAPHSPQILQLSGIGPKKLLSKLGIETIVDLPGVGQNFQDQPAWFMQYTYSNYPYPSPDWIVNNESWAADQLAIYYKNRTGPMTIPYFSGSIVTYLPLQNTTKTHQSIIKSASTVNLKSLLPADIDNTILAGYKAQKDLTLDLYKSTQATVEEVAWAGGETVSVAMLKPLSRGIITINSTNPSAPPVFDYRTFSHPTDLEVSVQALKKVREWMASGPMREIGPRETFPGWNVSGSDREIADALRGFVTSTWAHPTSSCSMMKKGLGGVVDPRLRVYGTKGLRVVDASIMPMIPGSHTSSTVYAVAEKAADIIKAAHQL